MFNLIKYQIILFFCFMVFILSSPAAYAASVSIAWDPSPDADAVGYRIYYGTESRNYSYPPVDVGNVTQYTLNGLRNNKTYYFALTTLTSDGKESDFSPEVATASEFKGTASLFARDKQSDACEMQEESEDSFEATMAFDFLSQQGNFKLKSKDKRISCRAGSFTQLDDNTIEAECKKKGPLGIFTLFKLKLRGMGNVSQQYPLTMSAEVYSLFNHKCPLYVIEMEELLPQ